MMNLTLINFFFGPFKSFSGQRKPIVRMVNWGLQIRLGLSFVLVNLSRSSLYSSDLHIEVCKFGYFNFKFVTSPFYAYRTF